MTGALTFYLCRPAAGRRRNPPGLTGAHSADFYVPAELNAPQGEMGHATIYLLEDGICLGAHPGCRFVR